MGRSRIISDGSYWEGFKRDEIERYTGPDGIPGLSSNQLIRPYNTKIVKSAGAAWTRIEVNRAVYVRTSDQRVIRYVPGHDPGDLSTGPALFNTGYPVAKLIAPGEWHVNTPLLTGDTEGQFASMIVSDASLGLENGDASGLPIPAPVAVQDQPLVWTEFAPITIAAADTLLLAANNNRRGLSLINVSTGGQVIGITTAAAAAAANRGVWILSPGQQTYVDEKCTRQGLRAWSSLAGGLISGAEGV